MRLRFIKTVLRRTPNESLVVRLPGQSCRQDTLQAVLGERGQHANLKAELAASVRHTDALNTVVVYLEGRAVGSMNHDTIAAPRSLIVRDMLAALRSV